MALLFIYFLTSIVAPSVGVRYGDFHLDRRSELGGTENVSDELSSEHEEAGLHLLNHG